LKNARRRPPVRPDSVPERSESAERVVRPARVGGYLQTSGCPPRASAPFRCLEPLMENPRPEKVAVVDEVKGRLSAAGAALLTEYRGINVSDMATLRRSLRAAGGEYKIYKNTLVRFAVRDLGLEIEDLLLGPTAIAFVERDAV